MGEAAFWWAERVLLPADIPYETESPYQKNWDGGRGAPENPHMTTHNGKDIFAERAEEDAKVNRDTLAGFCINILQNQVTEPTKFLSQSASSNIYGIIVPLIPYKATVESVLPCFVLQL